jgi:hypothetical protein
MQLLRARITQLVYCAGQGADALPPPSACRIALPKKAQPLGGWARPRDNARPSKNNRGHAKTKLGFGVV